MRILVIDDSAYARQRIVRVLKRAGHQVWEAASGNDALALLTQQPFDGATVDLLMPDTDGMALIRQLRSTYPDLRIVAVTADVQEETRQQTLEAGADVFLGKTDPPIRLREIFGTVPAYRLDFRPAERDAFTEMMNIAMGRAAQALSVLLGQRVLLRVPEVELLDTEQLLAFLEHKTPQVGAMIEVEFGGIIGGAAGLVFPVHHATTLIRALQGRPTDLEKLSDVEKAMLAEVGNVVLNAAVAQLADQLHVRLTMGLPAVVLNQSAAAVCELLLHNVINAEHALVVMNCLTLGETMVQAYVIIVLPGDTVERLLMSFAL